MNDLERFHRLFAYEKVDRCVYWGAPAPWAETIERWKREGYDPSKPFPLPHPDDRRIVQSLWFFPHPPFERKIIHEDEDTITYINHEGIVLRERKDFADSSMPQFIKFPVETREEFRRFRQERFRPILEERIGPNYKELLSSYKNRDCPLIIIADRWGGFFGGVRAMVGVEQACLLFYDDPAFLEEMMDSIADFLIAMMKQILQYTDVDIFGFWEDMAYKTGPLVGPELYRKFAYPRYKRVVDFLRSNGVKYISLDSDGNIYSLIPIWLDAGINVLYPFEVAAGMDVVKVRREFGSELRMWGGIDKRALAKGKEAIDRELKRVECLVREGGYIPCLDHSVPPDVPYENYIYYAEKLWELVNSV